MSWAESPMWATSSCPAVRSFLHLGPLSLRWNMTTRYLEVWSQKIFFKKNVFGFLRLPLFVLPSLVISWKGSFLSWLLWFFWYANLFSKAKEDVIKNHPENKIHVHFHHPIPHLQAANQTCLFGNPGTPSRGSVGFVWTCWKNPRIFRGRKRRSYPRGRSWRKIAKSPIFEQPKKGFLPGLFKVYIGCFQKWWVSPTTFGFFPTKKSSFWGVLSCFQK